jgi:hypothetical protein
VAALPQILCDAPSEASLWGEGSGSSSLCAHGTQDEDGSGEIDFGELNNQLRPSTIARNRSKVRKQAGGRKSSKLGSALLQPRSDVPIVDQLRDLLVRNRARVVDLFREWDDDGNGTIDRHEFRHALKALGVNASKADVDELFASFDHDQSGALGFEEVNKMLRQRAFVWARSKRPGTRSPTAGAGATKLRAGAGREQGGAVDPARRTQSV